MSKSLEKFMGVMKHHTSVIEARLQTEESGNKIAFMQGQCVERQGAEIDLHCKGLQEPCGVGDLRA